MDFIIIIFIIIPIFLLFIVSSWYNICSLKTMKQRIEIIKWLFKHNNYKELKIYYDRVTFGQHAFRLFCFRDPKKLYDPELFNTFHLLIHGEFKR